MMSAKDLRLNYIKNMIQNLCYIKSKGLEHFFYARIYDIRNDELKKMKRLFLWIIFANLVRILLTTMIQIVNFAWILAFNYRIGIDSISILIKILNIIENANNGLNTSLRNIFEIKVYIERLNEFLNSEELDFDYIKRFDSAGGLDSCIIIEHEQACQHSLVVRDASFYWRKKDDGEDILTNKVQDSSDEDDEIHS